MSRIRLIVLELDLPAGDGWPAGLGEFFAGVMAGQVAVDGPTGATVRYAKAPTVQPPDSKPAPVPAPSSEGEVEPPRRMTVSVVPKPSPDPEASPPERAALPPEKAERRRRARALFEQVEPILSLKEIGEREGASEPTLSKWGKEEGWIRPASRVRQTGKRSVVARARRNAVAPTGGGEDELPVIEVPPPVDRLPGVKRRCQECGRITWTDPCGHCGAPLFLKGKV